MIVVKEGNELGLSWANLSTCNLELKGYMELNISVTFSLKGNYVQKQKNATYSLHKGQMGE